ncbi:hypothetical protein FD06_GL001184 [Apilactobacillus ozensis DSM 23829 = JCM 17196]|uniref:Uncharacterized protein n=1 Tax=Apilactobacillus ozensis DSM 23829 = JCM 17196 TaxID=1423781 RepID=A0A0R2ARX6_9LACO|nr:hypothetical protein FD06_GL001184 [Apilactobacillus ozensis DSM 23829 = JCM 17196]
MSLLIIVIIGTNKASLKHHNYVTNFYLFIDNLESNKLNFKIASIDKHNLGLVANHKNYNLSIYKNMLRLTNNHNQGYLPMLDDVIDVNFTNNKAKTFIQVTFENHQKLTTQLLT